MGEREGEREGYVAALKRLFFLSRLIAVVDSEESDLMKVTANNWLNIQDGLLNIFNRYFKFKSSPVKAKRIKFTC